MSEILVAGAGHGGLIAAMKLAAAGHRVTVLEAAAEGDLGYPQEDAFDPEAMEYAGLEIPGEYRAPANRLTFVPLEAEVTPLTMPNKNEETLKVNRREFLCRLVALCREAGALFRFGCAVTAPLVLGSRVVGLETDEGRIYGDLIIDACGLNSPVRSQLPAFMQVEQSAAYYDYLHTYRACFKRLPGVEPPATAYNLYIHHDGTEGFDWAVTGQDEVDVLIARFYPISFALVAKELYAVSLLNPHMGQTLLRGGTFAEIPVRQPLAVMVADGYAAVGDAAFMTYPLKGSGIGYALMAGTMLAQAALQDENALFTADTLWVYERNFFKTVGFDACRIAIIKNLLPYCTAQDVNDIIKKGLLTSEELAGFGTDTLSTLLKARMKEKIRVLGDAPEIRTGLLNAVVWLGKFAVTESRFPNRYEREEVAEWAERYRAFFDSIRRPVPRNGEPGAEPEVR